MPGGFTKYLSLLSNFYFSCLNPLLLFVKSMMFCSVAVHSFSVSVILTCFGISFMVVDCITQNYYHGTFSLLSFIYLFCLEMVRYLSFCSPLSS